MQLLLRVLFVAGSLVAWLPAQDAAPDAQQQQRARILGIAREYAEFAWQGDAGNALHGPDANGIPVDTPDVSFDPQGWKPDAVNRGMPYALPSEAGAERATLVATVDGERVDTQSELRLPGGTIATGRRCERADALLEALVDFAAPEEPIHAVALREGTLTPGRYELGGRSFPAQRLQVVLTATHTVRHQDLPVTITVDVVLSPDVPAHGVLEARFAWETVWRAEPPLVGRNVDVYSLREFGGAD
jgi:hypothetical protein